MNRPDNSAACGFCNHKFGEHHESYDGKKFGCGWSYEDQRDGVATCNCKGFALVQRYNATSGSDHPTGQAYEQQWER